MFLSFIDSENKNKKTKKIQKNWNSFQGTLLPFQIWFYNYSYLSTYWLNPESFFFKSILYISGKLFPIFLGAKAPLQLTRVRRWVINWVGDSRTQKFQKCKFISFSLYLNRMTQSSHMMTQSWLGMTQPWLGMTQSWLRMTQSWLRIT